MSRLATAEAGDQRGRVPQGRLDALLRRGLFLELRRGALLLRRVLPLVDREGPLVARARLRG